MTAAIKIEGLSKFFRVGFWGKRVQAVTDLSFEVRQGDLFGFLGPNGAGKTTTIKALMGLIFPSGGQTWILGKKASEEGVRSRVGYLPESPYFYEYLKGLEFLDFYGSLFKIPKKVRVKKAEELLTLVNLEGAADLHLRKYSKGMLQRIGLAQALINDPELVILDEPMTGLDPIGRREIRDVMVRLKNEGKTVFFSTHILSDVEMICDQVGIVNKGKLVTTGKLSELLNPRIEYYEISFSQPDPAELEVLKPWVTNTFRDG
ncbi:MAG: ABC transporter ATP-binding protein, partial [Proteobacteria bacterium]|nr:ABC transporter ATP-binding protein [Pseudomonadota bacterium]